MTNDFVKIRRKKIKDLALKLCNKIPISNKILGSWIRSYHYSLPAYIFLTICIGPLYIVKICFLFLLIIILLFIYFRGCWLSIIEKELCKDDINIADWLIQICKYDVNKKNRYRISYLYFSLYLLSAITIAYMRFKN